MSTSKKRGFESGETSAPKKTTQSSRQERAPRSDPTYVYLVTGITFDPWMESSKKVEEVYATLQDADLRAKMLQEGQEGYYVFKPDERYDEYGCLRAKVDEVEGRYIELKATRLYLRPAGSMLDQQVKQR